MANTKLPSRLLDTSAVPALNVTGDLTVDTTTLVVDTTNNRVGIGRTSPPHKLTVFGTGAGNATVQIEGEGGADPYINFLANNTQHWSLGIDDSDSDKFKISKHSALGTNDYLNIDTSGNVVVGGTSVDAAGTISLQNDGDIRGVLASGAGGDSLISAISGVSNGFQITVDSSNNQTYKFHNGSGASLTIDSSGNVGIGIASPSTNLHIDGVSNYNGLEVKGAGGSRPMIQWSNANNGDLCAIYGTESNEMVLTSGSSNQERMRILNTGVVSLSRDVSQSIPNSTNTNLSLVDTDSIAAGIGASIVFGGTYSGTTPLSNGPYIKASKTNATDGDYGFGLKLAVRKMSSSQLVAMELTSDADVAIPEGNITVPNQPGFRARGTRSAWVYGATTTWNKITSANTGNASGAVYPIGISITGDNHVNGYNTGNCFNVSNGRFTAPVEGKYQTYGSIYCMKANSTVVSYNHFLVYLNGQQVNEIYTMGGHQHGFPHDYSLNFSTILFLEASDYVEWYIYSYDGNTAVYGAHCSIGAHLLS